MTDELYRDLGVSSQPPGVVLRKDGTSQESPYVRSSDASFPDRVDSLFGGKPAYAVYKNEQPEHRLMLWLALQGHSSDEIARTTGYHIVSVRNVKKQPWFRDAFVRLSTEFGRSAVETFLKAEALPALERTVDLAMSAKSEQVKLAANRDILDRAFGKPVAKVESTVTSSSTTLDLTVSDVAALLAERTKNEQILRASGISSGVN